MTTITDVAARAGVAPITVSRVVNESGPVSPEVRARVEAAIAATGYIPNAIARSLRNKKTGTIALVLTDLTNPFFTTLAHGAEQAAADAGLMLIVSNTGEQDAAERRYVEMLIQRRADGILLVPAADGTDAIRTCAEQSTPLVVMDRRLPGKPAVDVVRADSRGGAQVLGSLLADLGHRHAAILTGPATVPTAVDRVTGFRRAFADAGLPAPRVIHGTFSIESGREMAIKALRGPSRASSAAHSAARPAGQRPTALFAANNFIAIGVLRALEELGLRCPEDVAVVGFDDLPPAMVSFPFLTVAAQPAAEIGRQAVAMLLDRLANPARPPRELVLPTLLVVRRSSGGPVGARAAPPPPETAAPPGAASAPPGATRS